MSDNFGDIFECDLCSSPLEISREETLSSYVSVVNTNITNIFNKADSFLNRYMVYVCTVCGNRVRYTYKDVEKKIRKDIMERLLMAITIEYFNTTVILTDKYYMYCGKCNGFDGRGSCPKIISDKCDIKRFPNSEL